MTKAFSTSDSTSQVFYNILIKDGVKDQEIDGSTLAKTSGKPGGNGQPAAAENKDGKVGSQEVFAFVFSHFQKYGQAVREHFKKMGLDLSWLQAHGQLSKEKNQELISQLTGDGPRSLKVLAKKHIHIDLKTVDADPVTQTKQGLLEVLDELPEFQLLSLQDQEKVLSVYLIGVNHTDESVKDICESLKKTALTARAQNMTIEKKVAIGALLEARSLRDQSQNLIQHGNEKEGKALLEKSRALYLAAIEMDPGNADARLDLAEIHIAAGEDREARVQLQKGFENYQGFSPMKQMTRFRSLLSQKDRPNLLNEKENAWVVMGAALLRGGRPKAAKEAFEWAIRDADSAGDMEAREKYVNLMHLADEKIAGREFEIEFAGQNPVADMFLEELKGQGVATFWIDSVDHELKKTQGEKAQGDRKITADELFTYLGNNLHDKRVRHALTLALRGAGVELDKDMEEGIKKEGFAKFMAKFFAAEAGKSLEAAKKLPEKDSRRAAHLNMAQLSLGWAHYLEPRSETRLLALSDFLVSQGKYSEAVTHLTVAVARQQQETIDAEFNKDEAKKKLADPNRPLTSLEQKLLKVHQKGLEEGLKKADELDEPKKAVIENGKWVVKEPGSKENLAQVKAIVDGIEQQQALLVTVLPQKALKSENLHQVGNANRLMGDLYLDHKMRGEADRYLKAAVGHYSKAFETDRDNNHNIDVLQSRAYAYMSLGDHGGALADLWTRGSSVDFILPEMAMEFSNYEDHVQDLHKKAKQARIEEENKRPPDEEKLQAALQNELKLTRALNRTTKSYGKETPGEETGVIKELLDKIGEKGQAERLDSATQAVLKQAKEGLITTEGLKPFEGFSQKDPAAKHLGALSQYVNLTASGSGTSVNFTEAYQNLSVADKHRVLGILNKSGERACFAKSLMSETDPVKQVYYESRIALIEGDLPKAYLSMQRFQRETEATHDPDLQKMRDEIQPLLENLQKQATEVRQKAAKETLELMGPLVNPLYQDEKGSLDLSKIKANNFQEFKQFLIEQVTIDGIAFNEYGPISSYFSVLKTGKHDELLEILYLEANPDATDVSQIDTPNPQNLNKAIRSLTEEFISVSPDHFVGQHFSSEKGRERLRYILTAEDPFSGKKLFSKDNRAYLIRSMIATSERQGVGSLHAFIAKDSISTWDWFNVRLSDLEFREVSEGEIDKATRQMLGVLDTADWYDKEQQKIMDRYELHPEKVHLLRVDSLKPPITQDDVKKYYQIWQTNQHKADPVSQMKAKMARFWLLTADEANWGLGENINLAASRENRAKILQQTQQFIARLDSVHTEGDLVKFSDELFTYFDGVPDASKNSTINAVGQWLMVVDGVDTVFEDMPPKFSSPYEDLKKFAGGIKYGKEMGMNIHMDFSDIQATDYKTYQAAVKFIQGLEEAKRSMWYGYKQHGALSRAGSNMRAAGWSGENDPFGGGDIIDIRMACGELDSLIALVKKAKTPEDLKKVYQQMQGEMRQGGYIYAGFDAAEMDGTEQLIGIGRIVLETIAISVATKGLGAAPAILRATAQFAVAFRRVMVATSAVNTARRMALGVRLLKAGQTAHRFARFSYNTYKMGGVLGRVGQTWSSYNRYIKGLDQARKLEFWSHIPLRSRMLGRAILHGDRMARMFALGAAITWADKATAYASDQLVLEPSTIETWLKDAVATGASMALLAPLAPAAAEGGLIRGMVSRYLEAGARGSAKEAAKGALRYLADAGLEAVEEVVDAYVRNALDGDYNSMTWEQLREITLVCVGGGGTQMGAAVQSVAQTYYDYRSGNLQGNAPITAPLPTGVQGQPVVATLPKAAKVERAMGLMAQKGTLAKKAHALAADKKAKEKKTKTAKETKASLMETAAKKAAAAKKALQKLLAGKKSGKAAEAQTGQKETKQPLKKNQRAHGETGELEGAEGETLAKQGAKKLDAKETTKISTAAAAAKGIDEKTRKDKLKKFLEKLTQKLGRKKLSLEEEKLSRLIHNPEQLENMVRFFVVIETRFPKELLEHESMARLQDEVLQGMAGGEMTLDEAFDRLKTTYAEIGGDDLGPTRESDEDWEARVDPIIELAEEAAELNEVLVTSLEVADEQVEQARPKTGRERALASMRHQIWERFERGGKIVDGIYHPPEGSGRRTRKASPYEQQVFGEFEEARRAIIPRPDTSPEARARTKAHQEAKTQATQEPEAAIDAARPKVPRPDTSPEGRARTQASPPQVPRPDARTTVAQSERRKRIAAIQNGFLNGDRLVEVDGEYRYQTANSNEPSRQATREEIAAHQEWEAPAWLDADGKVLADSRGIPRPLDFTRGRRPVIGSKGHLKLEGDGILAAHAKIERRGAGDQVQYVIHRTKGPDGKPAMVRFWDAGKETWVPVPPKGMVIQPGMKFWVGSAKAKVPHPNVWAAGEVDTGPHMPHGQVFGFSPQYAQAFQQRMAEADLTEVDTEVESEEKTSADSEQGHQGEGRGSEGKESLVQPDSQELAEFIDTLLSDLESHDSVPTNVAEIAVEKVLNAVEALKIRISECREVLAQLKSSVADAFIRTKLTGRLFGALSLGVLSLNELQRVMGAIRLSLIRDPGIAEEIDSTLRKTLDAKKVGQMEPKLFQETWQAIGEGEIQDLSDLGQAMSSNNLEANISLLINNPAEFHRDRRRSQAINDLLHEFTVARIRYANREIIGEDVAPPFEIVNFEIMDDGNSLEVTLRHEGDRSKLLQYLDGLTQATQGLEGFRFESDDTGMKVIAPDGQVLGLEIKSDTSAELVAGAREIADDMEAEFSPHVPAELRREVYHLAKCEKDEMPFAEAAQELIDGKITPEEYQAKQAALSERLVNEHREALAKIEALLQQAANNEDLNIEWTEARSKDAEKIIPKLIQRGWNSLKAFPDFAGARVIFNSFFNGDQFSTTAFMREMKPVFESEGIEIRAFYDSEGNEVCDAQGYPVKDWDQYRRYLIGHPKSGHRTINIGFEYKGKPVEIQLMTSLQYEWSKPQHDFYEIRDELPPQEAKAINGFFKDAADLINAYEIGANISEATKPVIPELSPFTAKRFEQQFNQVLNLIDDLLAKSNELTRQQAALVAQELAEADTNVDGKITAREVSTRPGTRMDSGLTRVTRRPGAPVSPEVISNESSPSVRVIQFTPFILGAKGFEAEHLLEEYFRKNTELYPDVASRQELLTSLENKHKIFTVDSDGILHLEEIETVRTRRKTGLETFAEKIAPVLKRLSPEDRKILLHGLALRLTGMGGGSEARVKTEVEKIATDFTRLTREARMMPGRVFMELAFLYLSGKKTSEDISSLARRYGYVVSTLAMWGLTEAPQKLAKSFLSQAFSQEKNLHRHFEKSLSEAEPIIAVLQAAIATLPPGEAKMQQRALVSQVFRKQVPITRAWEIAVELTVGRVIGDTNKFQQALIPKLRQLISGTQVSDEASRRSFYLKAQIDQKGRQAEELQEEIDELNQRVSAGIDIYRATLEEEAQAYESFYQARHQEFISQKVVFELVLRSQVPILIDKLKQETEKLTQELHSDNLDKGREKEMLRLDPDLEVKSVRVPGSVQSSHDLAGRIQDLKSVVSQLEQAESLDTTSLYNLMIDHVPTKLFSDLMGKRFEMERMERRAKEADAELARLKSRAHRPDVELHEELDQLAEQAEEKLEEANKEVEERVHLTEELNSLDVDDQTRSEGNLHVRLHNILARHQKNPGKSILMEELSAHFFDARLPVRKMVALAQALQGLTVEQQAQLVFEYLVAYEKMTDSATTNKTSSTRPEGQEAMEAADDQTKVDGKVRSSGSPAPAPPSLDRAETPSQLVDQLISKAQALPRSQEIDEKTGTGSPEARSAEQSADLMGRGAAYAVGTPALVATMGMAQGMDSATTASLALLSAALTPIMGMAFSWVSDLFKRKSQEAPNYPTEADPLKIEDEGAEFLMYRFGREQLEGRRVLPGDIGQIRPEHVELQPGSRQVSVYFTRRGLDANNQIIENKPVLLVTLNEAQANRLGIFIDEDGTGLNTDQLIQDEIFIMSTKDAPAQTEANQAALQLEDFLPSVEKREDQESKWLPAYGGANIKSQFDFYHPQQDGPLTDHPLNHVARVANFEPLSEPDRFVITLEIYDPTDPAVLPKDISNQSVLDFNPESAQVLETRRYEVSGAELMGMGVPFFGASTDINSLNRHLFSIRDQYEKLDETNPVVLFKENEGHSLAIYRDKDLNPRKLPGIKLYHAQIDPDSVRWGEDGWVEMDFLSQIPGQDPTYIGTEEMRVEDARRLGVVAGREGRVRLVAAENVFLIGSINASQYARAHFDPQLKDPKRRYAFAQALVDWYDSDTGRQSLDPTWVESAKKYIEAYEKAQEKGEVFTGRTREPAFIENLDVIRRSYALEMYPFGIVSEQPRYQLGFFDPRWGIDTHGAEIFRVERVSDSGLIILRNDQGQEKAITTGSMFKKHPFQVGDQVRLYDTQAESFEPIQDFITDSWLPPSGAAFSAGGLGLLGLTFGTGWVATAGLAVMAGGAALASFSFLLGYMAAKGKLQATSADLIKEAPPASGVFNRETAFETTLPGVPTPEQLGRQTINKNSVMYSVGAPAGIFMTMSAHGISPGWSFLAAAASALFSSSLLGMVWQGKKAGDGREPITLRPPQGKNIFTLGRGDTVDVLLDSASVSRQHATFYRSGDGQWYVIDGVEGKPSSNGIAISSSGSDTGAQKMFPGTWYPIKEGDILQIGDQQLVFKAPAQSEQVSENYIGVAKDYFMQFLAQDHINYDLHKLTQQETAVTPDKGDRYKLAQAILYLISQNYHMECDFSGMVSHETQNVSGERYLLQPPSQKYEILPGFKEAKVLGGNRVDQTIYIVVETSDGLQEFLSLPYSLSAPFKINLNLNDEIIIDPAPTLWMKDLEAQGTKPDQAALRQVRLQKPVPPPQAPGPKERGIHYLDQLERFLAQNWQTNHKGDPTDPNWKDHRDYRGGLALIAHAGTGHKYTTGKDPITGKKIPVVPFNEDRTDFVQLPDGRTVSIAIDGMGGHGGGEMAATIAQKVFRMALQEGHPLDAALQIVDHAIAEHNQRTGRIDPSPGATAVLVEMTPTGPGTYRGRFAKVADADALVIRPSLLGKGDAIIDWTETTHPDTPKLPELDPERFSDLDPDSFKGGPGGRMPRRMTLYNRLNPRGNVIETSLGGGNVNPHFFEGQQEFQDGDIIISGSDGLHESFWNKDRIQEVVDRALHANPGKNTAKVVADALRQESLIRMWLYAHKRKANEILTHDSYAEAYRAVMGEEPPVDFRGMYEPTQDAQGNRVQFRLNKSGEVERITTAQPQGELFDSFGDDNLSIAVQVLGQETSSLRPNWPGLGANHRVDPNHLRALSQLNMRERTREQLNDSAGLGVAPVTRVDVGGNQFYLSRVIEEKDERGNLRKFVLALVPVFEEGKWVLKRRFFVKHQSDQGSWRASPYQIGGHIAKGLGRHYTQETQIAPEIMDRIHELESANNPPELDYRTLSEDQLARYIDVSSLDQEFSGDAKSQVQSMVGGFGKEVQVASPKGLTAIGGLQPGRVFKGNENVWAGMGQQDQDLLSQLENLALPDGFLPKFDLRPPQQGGNLIRTYTMFGEITGEITCHEFAGGQVQDKVTGRIRPVIWTMAEDSQGRTWVKGIRYQDAKVTSYGTYQEVVDSGVLTSKPLEYYQQAMALYKFGEGYVRDLLGVDGRPHPKYVDISPTLGLLEPIKRYREARRLPSNVPYHHQSKAKVKIEVKEDQVNAELPAGKPVPGIPGLFHFKDHLWAYKLPSNFQEITLKTLFPQNTSISATNGHGLIYRKGGRVWIRDNGSTNGTKVFRGDNFETPIYQHHKQGTPGQVFPLEPGDWVSIGGEWIRIE